jgi:thiol-disulfide isomerase/thioredoxin
MRLVFLVVLAACSQAKEKPKAQPRPATPTTPAAPAPTATTGPVTMLAADGAPMNPFTIAEYKKQFATSQSVVVARAFPEGLSPLAGAGVNIQALGKNVSWVIDGEPTRGFAFAYDENANGDLRDDPQHRFAKTGDVWELSFAMKIEAPFSGEMLDAPMRIRMRNGELRFQKAIERRGTITLPKGPMSFALIGDSGQFGLDHHYIAFDLDRNGTLDTDTLDNPELFHIFEKAVTLDDTSYTFELAPDGSVLTLRPMKERLPPRPPLTTGTPAPELSITDLDGKPATLSSLRGKVVLLDFWSTACHPCVKALPHIAELRTKLHDRGFEVMAIADAQDGVRETLGANRSGIEAQDDAAQAIYRVDRFPMYFLVGRDGTILCSRCQLDTLEPMIEPALAVK